MLNTIKTTLGFLVTLLERKTPLSFAGKSTSRIYNYLLYGEPDIATSGQPSEAELKLIAGDGYGVVINLAPHNAENSLADERASVTDLGMAYTNIPVDFKRPTDADFSDFCAALDRHDNDKVWVHCAANMRVSAFVYRFRRTQLSHSEEEAQKDLHKIWQPFGVWKVFVKS